MSHCDRVAIRLAFLIALVGMAPFSVAAAPQDETHQQFVDRTSGRFAYGIYIGDNKIGWAIEDSRMGKHAERPAAIFSSAGQIVMVVRDVKTTIDWQLRSVYDIKDDGKPLLIEERTKEDGVTTTFRAVRDGEHLVITTIKADKPPVTRKTDLPKETLSHLRQLDQWLATNRTQGAQFEAFSTSLEDESINARETFTFLGKKTVRLSGVPTQITRVRNMSDGAVFNMELLPGGTMYRGKIGPFDLRMEEEATVKNLEVVTLDDAFDITSNQELGDPEQVDGLKLELRGLGDFKIPQSPRQRVSEGKNGVVQLSIQRQRADDRPKQKAKLSDADRQKFLKKTATVQSDDEATRRLAVEIIQGASEPQTIAKQINQWVFDNLKKTYRANATTSNEVLANRAGDCTEHTLLFLALARAAGVPAREVGGLVYEDVEKPIFAWHAWAEFYDGYRWVSLDPTWNQVHVDATHIKLSSGEKDLAWVNVLGKLQLKVMSFERKD